MEKNIYQFAEKVEKLKIECEKDREQVEYFIKNLLMKREFLLAKGVNPEARKIKPEHEQYLREIKDVRYYKSVIRKLEKKVAKLEAAYKLKEGELNRNLEILSSVEDRAPLVIKQFLQKRKDYEYEWHSKKYESYLQFVEKLDKDVEEVGIAFIKTSPHFKHVLDENGEIKPPYIINDTLSLDFELQQLLDLYMRKMGLDDWAVRDKKKKYPNDVVEHMLNFSDDKKRFKWLEAFLEAERKMRMYDLLVRVESIVGSVTDATRLILHGGNLNGIIIGTKGKAEVETIIAGGYNIQREHFRTLVYEIS